ncbi:uncharacterized protein LOC127804421 [Diospyros lotus]|uniref:uncharacterized protein LOC127804421 n=1 Tax=Diospyros lotus TaxID=55363 RepID=UPI002259B535|nr:uncharacterized protein LOC127804421 [Diospyros lotus]
MPSSDDQHGQSRRPSLWRIVQNEGAGYDAQVSLFNRKSKRQGFDKVFYEAVRRGDLNAVKEMLRKNSELLNTEFTLLENNALQVAVVARQEDIVRHLLEQNPDPEFLKIKNGYGDTTLTLAAATGSRAIVQLLVETYEDLVDIKNAKRELPVVVAAFCGCEETFRYLYDITLVETLYVSKEDQNLNTVQVEKEKAVGYHNGFMLFKACITAEIYDIALVAFKEAQNQCIEEMQKEKGETLCSLALDFRTPRINGFLPWLFHNDFQHGS